MKTEYDIISEQFAENIKRIDRQEWVTKIMRHNYESEINKKIIIALKEKVEKFYAEINERIFKVTLNDNNKIKQYGEDIPNFDINHKNRFTITLGYSTHRIPYDVHLELLNENSWIDYDMDVRTEITIKHAYATKRIVFYSKLPQSEIATLEKLGKIKYETHTTSQISCSLY